MTPERMIDPQAYYPEREREVSINWEDDPTVEQITLADNKNAQHGAARLRRVSIERMCKVAAAHRPLMWERKETPDNPHHGNIIYSESLSRPAQRMLAAALALHSEYVAPRKSAPA